MKTRSLREESADDLERAEPTFDKIVGEFIRTLRLSNNLTQKKLEGLTGIPQSIISAMENGERTVRGEHIDDIIVGMKMEISAAFRALYRIAKQMSERSLDAFEEPEERPYKKEELLVSKRIVKGGSGPRK